MGFPGGSDSKESACNVEDLSLIPGSERSPGEGNGNPLQYFCLENPMDRGAWQATVHAVAKSQTQLTRLSSSSSSSDGKVFACNVGDLGSVPGSGRPLGDGNGNPLQYFCLENPMDRGVWWATVHGVAKSWTQLTCTQPALC